VASSTSLNAVVRASVGQGFMAILQADQEREFPLIFKRGELLDDDCKEVAPFVMIVSWRRNSSYWLPQIPKIIFSSAKAMRGVQVSTMTRPPATFTRSQARSPSTSTTHDAQ
jgi:hypothetical protein